MSISNPSAALIAPMTGHGNTTTPTNSATSAFASQLGPDAFLKLLTTQLAHQDPLSPMDDTQSVAQLAQFSQLQATTNLSSSFTSFQQNFGIIQSAGIIGKNVAVNDTTNGGVIQGTVSGIGVSNGVPSFTMKDAAGKAIGHGGSASSFGISQILSIS